MVVEAERRADVVLLRQEAAARAGRLVGGGGEELEAGGGGMVGVHFGGEAHAWAGQGREGGGAGLRSCHHCCGHGRRRHLKVGLWWINY